MPTALFVRQRRFVTNEYFLSEAVTLQKALFGSPYFIRNCLSVRRKKIIS